MIGSIPLATVRELRLLGATVIKLGDLTLAFDSAFIPDAPASETTSAADERKALFDSADDD